MSRCPTSPDPPRITRFLTSVARVVLVLSIRNLVIQFRSRTHPPIRAQTAEWRPVFSEARACFALPIGRWLACAPRLRAWTTAFTAQQPHAIEGETREHSLHISPMPRQTGSDCRPPRSWQVAHTSRPAQGTLRASGLSAIAPGTRP